MKIPFINQDIKNRVYDVIEIGYITEGPVTRKFESKLKKLLGLFPNAKKINYTC